MLPFLGQLPYFENIKRSLWDHLDDCVCICVYLCIPPKTFRLLRSPCCLCAPLIFGFLCDPWRMKESDTFLQSWESKEAITCIIIWELPEVFFARVWNESQFMNYFAQKVVSNIVVPTCSRHVPGSNLGYPLPFSLASPEIGAIMS